LHSEAISCQEGFARQALFLSLSNESKVIDSLYNYPFFFTERVVFNVSAICQVLMLKLYSNPLPTLALSGKKNQRQKTTMTI
jgi:hypothetical protein